MPSPKQKGSKGKGKGGKEPAPPGAKSSSPARAKPKAKKEKKKKPAEIVEEEPIDDGADIVVRVARMMKSNKLSQVQVGQEARVSQAVISQWLARKYARLPPSRPLRCAAAPWGAAKRPLPVLYGLPSSEPRRPRPGAGQLTHDVPPPQVPRAQRQSG